MGLQRVRAINQDFSSKISTRLHRSLCWPGDAQDDYLGSSGGFGNTGRVCLHSGGCQHSLDFLVFGIAYPKNDFVSLLRPPATERAADIACSNNCYFHLAPFLVAYLVSVSSVDSLANHHPSNRDGNPENLSSVWFFPNRHRQRRVGSSYCQRERPRRGICNEGVIKMSEAERFVARAGTKMKPMKQTATMLQDAWMIRLKSARRS